MPLTRLVLDDFRNIRSVELRPSAQLNFFFGDNGSGKTSLLEALSTLALGRSFRTRKYRHLIRYGEAQFCLFGEYRQSGQSFRVGVSRAHSGDSQFRLNDQNVTSALELAALVPMQVIDHQSFQLFDGGPSERRHFIDWLVFHVKPEFRKVWLEYGRCLKQRNALLRSDRISPPDLVPWDATLARLGETIGQFRVSVLEMLLQRIPEFLSQCAFLSDAQLQIRYAQGWDDKGSLAESFERNRQRDLRLGQTYAGPHKADLHFQFRGVPVGEVFSRGQQKSLMSALFMAQLAVLLSNDERNCILLVDDLPAELDPGNLARLARWMAQLPRTQFFITGIDRDSLVDQWPDPEQLIHCKLFHVKQGEVSECPRESGVNND